MQQLDCLIERLREQDPERFQLMLLDSLDLSSGQWADLHGGDLERHGLGWEEALELYGCLRG